MNYERDGFSPKEETFLYEGRKERIVSWLSKRGVDLVVFDFDDTLIDTVTVFRQQIAKYLSVITPGFPNISPSYIEQRLRRINDQLFYVYAVNPGRWRRVAERLTDEFGGTSFLDGLPTIEEIYTMVPSPYPDVEEVLGVLGAVSRLGLVTHANKAWTDLKVSGLGWGRFFEGRIETINEDGHKTAGEWRKAFLNLGVSPERALVIGDNVRGDILATREIGVLHHFWVDRKKNWALYREGELPEEVVTIEELSEMIAIMASE
jgi:FMN phosphatase YigB (HAD superfamily)